MSDEKKKIVIVGGVAGGASAAARARRLSENAEIIIIERSANVSFANCGLPYHIGETIEQRSKLLVTTPKMLWDRFRIEVRVLNEVTDIDAAAKTVKIRRLEDGSEYEESYDALILSPGGKPVTPDIEGVSLSGVHVLRNLEDMDAIKEIVDREHSKSAVVVGGGFIGLETAEELRGRDMDVTLVQRSGQVFSMFDKEMTSPIMQQLAVHGVDVRLNTQATKIDQIEGDGLKVTLTDGTSIDADVVVMGIGVRPESILATKAGIKLGKTGGIAVSESMQTSDANIWAAGDAVEVTHFVTGEQTVIPLAGPANRQGRLAADSIFGRTVSYNATQGTAVCKIFDITVAATGINEKHAKKLDIGYEKVYVHPQSHAGYYPGAVPMTIKLLYSTDDAKILGAQIVGSDGVDKRIDVFATAIRAELTAYDLEELELAYAPPYGSAKDPVNIAGFVAANQLRGDVKLCHYEDIKNIADNQVVLDVRTAAEISAGSIENSITMPVDELRDRLGELPRDKQLLVLCQAGLRGYIACRILSQNGFDCRNLTGGYKVWKMFNEPFAVTKKTTACGKDMEVEKMANDKNIISGEMKVIDACGLQCPGPIMQLKTAMDEMGEGESLRIRSTDPGFIADVPAWCNSTGNSLVATESVGGGVYEAIICKGKGSGIVEQTLGKDKTIVVFSNDFDKVMAAFIIANGAAAMGSKVTLFFTFWGLNVLRRPEKVSVKKNLIEKMFGWMMPRGVKKLALSKMNFAGMGKMMMLGIMNKKNVAPLDALIGSAKLNGVKMVACAMSMDVMGIKEEELIDGVEIGGVAMYLDHAERGGVNLFI